MNFFIKNIFIFSNELAERSKYFFFKLYICINIIHICIILYICVYIIRPYGKNKKVNSADNKNTICFFCSLIIIPKSLVSLLFTLH